MCYQNVLWLRSYGARRARVKKFFVRVTEYWLHACERDKRKKLNATEILRYKGVATFSIGGETSL